ncbi:hypothetical protein OY671_010016, partial [Metschnikowia pulcherrima]
AYRKFDGNYSSGDSSPFNTGSQANRVYNHQFSQESRSSAKSGDMVNSTVGGFYSDRTSRNRSRVTSPTSNFIEDNRIPGKTKAVFANAEVSPLARSTISGGIRYTDQSKTFIYGREGIPGSSTGGAVPASSAPLNGSSREFSGSRVDYRLGAQYHSTDAIMGYAQFSTGFKGGGINPRPFFPAQA